MFRGGFCVTLQKDGLWSPHFRYVGSWLNSLNLNQNWLLGFQTWCCLPPIMSLWFSLYLLFFLLCIHSSQPISVIPSLSILFSAYLHLSLSLCPFSGPIYLILSVSQSSHSLVSSIWTNLHLSPYSLGPSICITVSPFSGSSLSLSASPFSGPIYLISGTFIINVFTGEKLTLCHQHG